MQEFKDNTTKDMKMKKAKASAEKKAASPAALPAKAAEGGSAVASASQGRKVSGGTASDVNLEYYHAVQEDLRVIGKCLGFDFGSKPPLQIAEKNTEGQGGVQEPWNGDMAVRALGNQAAYLAAVNLLWIDFTRSACPGVPLSRKRVLQLAEFMYPDEVVPAFVKKTFEVLAAGTEQDQQKQPQGLLLLSPDEYGHAILAACAAQLPKNKERWEIILRSVPCMFSLVPPENVWIASWNNRNEITQEYESLSRSALQTATEIALLKHRADLEKCRTLKTDEFAQWLKEQGLKKATSQQDMSKNFLDSALFVAKKYRIRKWWYPSVRWKRNLEHRRASIR